MATTATIYLGELGMITVDEASLDTVRYDFNPAASKEVAQIKLLAAALITACQTYGRDGRTAALARTAAEESSMWGVKSATFQTPHASRPSVHSAI